jgi:RNA polymerase sigma-70 factor (ECF subfamily)
MILLVINQLVANPAASDNQLMEDVVNRKADALESIYRRYGSLLRTVILGVIRDESDVEDVLHDVLLQVWEQSHRYNPNENGLRGLLTLEVAPTTNQVEVNDLSKLLNRAIQVLPEAQKEVIDLAFFKGMSQREIASKRQISLGTVKTRLHLAQRKLHNYLVPMQNKI